MAKDYWEKREQAAICSECGRAIQAGQSRTTQRGREMHKACADDLMMAESLKALPNNGGKPC